jgi:hypothetical protein
LEKF